MHLPSLLPKQRPPTHAIEFSGPVPAGTYTRCTCGECDCRPTKAEALDSWLDHCLFRSLIEATA